MALALGWMLHARLRGGERGEYVRPLRSLIGREWGPVLGLLFLGVLQNVDVIMGKHTLGGDRAGSYAAAAVAAQSRVTGTAAPWRTISAPKPSSTGQFSPVSR